MRDFIGRFLPEPLQISHAERLRAAVGALVGILVTGLVSRMWLGPSSAHLPLLIAPMGASAVLLFAVPASPLAQPWSILGGNMVSALVGVTAAHAIVDPVLAAAAAIACAIAAMSILRCLHPPGGAVALTAVLGGPAIAAAGYDFALVPVGLNSLLLAGTALIFNNATRHSYPHRPHVPHENQHQTADPAPGDRIGFVPDDLDAALRDYGEMLEISRDDLDLLFHAVERRAHQRLHGVLRCAAIMSRDVVTVAPDTTRGEIAALMQRHAVHALPVIDSGRQVIGVCVDRDLLFAEPGAGALAHDLMRPLVPVLDETTPIEELVPFLLDSEVPCVLAIDAEKRLTGIVTRSDLVAALYRAPAMGMVAPARTGAA